MSGTLDIKYANERETKKSLMYRLSRRAFEVTSAIEKYAITQKKYIADLGTADGRMLQIIYEKYPESNCVGIEYDKELVEFGKRNFPDLNIIQGDIQSIEYADNYFDVVVATAVIEHVPEPVKVISESKRILKPGGILILSAPDPFWEYIATKVGHLDDEQHNEVMNLKQLSDLIETGGFEVLEAYKFMLSPVGMPFEFIIERLLRKLKLDSLMANQIVVGRA